MGALVCNSMLTPDELVLCRSFNGSDLKAVGTGYAIYTSIPFEPPPPPEPSPPAPGVPLNTYEAESVSSTVSFGALELSSFEDAAFNASFRANFTQEMATSAGVSISEIEIVAITSGSTQVESLVHFSALSAGDSSSDDRAASFAQLVDTSPADIFAASSFEQFGEQQESALLEQAEIMKQIEASGNLGGTPDTLESVATRVNEIEGLLAKLTVFKSRYHIDTGKAICKGASGVVCFGMDRVSKNMVALKFFAHRKEFEAELENCSACHSIYIVKVLDMCSVEEQASPALAPAELTSGVPAASPPAPDEPALIQGEDAAVEGTAVDGVEAETGKEGAVAIDVEPIDEFVDAPDEGAAQPVVEEKGAEETATTDGAQDTAAAEVAAAPAPVASPAVIENKPPATIDDFCCLVLERGEFNLQEYLKKASRRLDSVKKKGILSDIFNALSAMHRNSVQMEEIAAMTAVSVTEMQAGDLLVEIELQ
eukprot:gene6582-7882_t